MKLDSLINKTIKEIRVRSFYINQELISEVLCIFLNYEEDLWLKITISDNSLIVTEDEEPNVVELSDIRDEFAYPVKKIITTNLPNTIKSIIPLYDKNDDTSYGLIIIFYDNTYIVLLEIEENIVLYPQLGVE